MMRFTSLFVTRLFGVIGMCFPIYGNFIPPSTTRDTCFVAGSVLMLITSAAEKESFFTALQLIILAGAGAAFTPFTTLVKAIFPITTAIVCLGYFAYTGKLKCRLTQFGCLGIIILALGYAVSNPFLYLAGGSILAVYSFASFKQGVEIALLWAVLNTVFAGAALYNIVRFVL